MTRRIRMKIRRTSPMRQSTGGPQLNQEDDKNDLKDDNKDQEDDNSNQTMMTRSTTSKR